MNTPDSRTLRRLRWCHPIALAIALLSLAACDESDDTSSSPDGAVVADDAATTAPDVEPPGDATDTGLPPGDASDTSVAADSRDDGDQSPPEDTADTRDLSDAGDTGDDTGLDGTDTTGPTAPAWFSGDELHVNDAFTTDDQHQPVVAVGSAGHAAVVWMSQGQADPGATTAEVYLRTWAPGGTSSSAASQVSQVAASNTYYGREHYDVGVADDGRVVVAWAEYEGDNAVYAQRFDASGAAQGGPIVVDASTDAWSEYEVAVAVHADGSFAVAYDWEAGFSTGGRIHRFDASGVSLGEHTWFTNERRIHELDLAALSNGSYVGVWRYHDLDMEVFAAVIASDATVSSAEIHVNSLDTDAQDQPAVAALPDGGFVVVWRTEATSSGRDAIAARFFDATGMPTTAELAVSTMSDDSQETPSVGVDGQGRVVVVWAGSDVDADWTEVWATVLDTSGATLEPVERVNTWTDFKQEAPSVGVAGDGRALVVWEDHDQESATGSDADEIGVYGQWLALP